MSEEFAPPVLHYKLTPLSLTEGVESETFHLSHFIENPEGVDQPIKFSAFLKEGGPLPEGIALSEAGDFTCYPARGTGRDEPYIAVIFADNGSHEPLKVELKITIAKGLELPKEEPLKEKLKEAVANAVQEALPEAPTEVTREEVPAQTPQEIPKTKEQGPAVTMAEPPEGGPTLLHGMDFKKVKQDIWQQIAAGNTPEEVKELFSGDPTFAEIYYMLGRFADFVIWNADNMSAPALGKTLKLDGVSSHFKVVDRGPCLVSVPNELYSHDRTLTDAVATAKAMAREAYRRNWNVEFGGFDKMVSAAWVELQALMADPDNDKISILYYTPSEYDKFLLKLKQDGKSLV